MKKLVSVTEIHRRWRTDWPNEGIEEDFGETIEIPLKELPNVLAQKPNGSLFRLKLVERGKQGGLICA